MKRKIFSTLFALVLVCSFGLVTAVPVAAADPNPLSGYEIITSPSMAYGDGGWGGCSVPAGKVVLGGGFYATAPVAASAPGTPDSTWPHYTYGPHEYGWVVRDAPDGVPNTITIYAICADEPAGYEVVESDPLNYSDGGWAGWSVPNGKVVLGGGFVLSDPFSTSAGAAAVSVPGTPNSSWPHGYTYGPDEYGWCVRAAEDGVSDPDSKVYAIYADEPAGYGVVTSGSLNYGDGGWAGWSVPNGKVVLGGGFNLTGGPAAVSVPGTPDSVWPHYPYGPHEYGWVVRDAPDGASSPGSTVYAIYASLTEVWVDDDWVALGPGEAADGHTFGYDAFASIQEGIAAVAIGGTVNVAAGTYNPTSTIVINKDALILQGPQAGEDPRPSYGSTRTPGSPSEAVIDGSANALGVIIAIDADNVVINGLEVKSGTGDMINQKDTPYSGTTVKYCIIHDGRGDEGVQLKKCTGGVLEYNYVFEIANPGDGLNIADTSSDGVIRYNEVVGIHGENAAIYIYDAAHMEIIGNLVRDSGSGGNDGIKVGSKGGTDAALRDVLVKDNIIHGITQDGISVYMSGVTVDGNEVYECGSENGAIYLAHAISDITIQNNSVHDNVLQTGKYTDAAGILIGTDVDASTVTINFNNIYNNSPYGVTNHASGIVDATSNWWGDATPDFGTIVSGNVAYSPWLGATIDISPMTFIVDDVGPKPAAGYIQTAINAADPGDTVNVAAGTYPEDIDVDKAVAIIGAGQANTEIQGSVTITAPDGLDRVVLQDLTVISPWETSPYIVDTYYAIYIDAEGGNTAPVTIQNVTGRTTPTTTRVYGAGVLIGANGNTVDDVVIDSCTFNENSTHGMFIENLQADGGFVTNVTLSNSTFDDNNEKGEGQGGWGLYIKNGTYQKGPFVNHFTVTNCSFNDHLDKGIYAESLSNATFTNVTANNNYKEGCDINLKYATYENLVFNDCTFTGNGTTTDSAGLIIKGRNDGDTYGAHPASLTGVDINGGTFSGNAMGISVGNNVTDIEIHDANISGNYHTEWGINAGVVNWTDSAIINATNNWWGDVSGPYATTHSDGLGDMVSDNVHYSPWCAADDDDLVTPGYQRPEPMTWGVNTNGTIQEAIDAASPNDTINVAAGTYNENVVVPVDKPHIKLIGAGSNVTTISITTGAAIKTAAPITVEGFHIQGPGRGTGDALFLRPPTDDGEPTSGTEVNPGVFKDNKVTGVNYGVKSGDFNIHHWDFLGNDFSELRIGIGLENTSYVKVIGNSFKDYKEGVSMGWDSDTAHHVEIRDNEFLGTTDTELGAAILISSAAQEIQVLENKINDSIIGVLIKVKDTPTPDLTNVNINWNDIVGNTDGVVNESTKEVDAPYNWWGNPNGPGAAVFGTYPVGDTVSGNVSYSPWLPGNWELFFVPLTGEERDSDNDGFSNLEEYWLGTDSDNATDYPGAAIDPGQVDTAYVEGSDPDEVTLRDSEEGTIAEVDISDAPSDVSGTVTGARYTEDPGETSLVVGTGKTGVVFLDVRVTGYSSGTAHIIVPYPDDNDDSIVDDTDPAIVEATLGLYYWDEAASMWLIADKSAVDTDANIVSGDIPVSALGGTPIGTGGYSEGEATVAIVSITNLSYSGNDIVALTITTGSAQLGAATINLTFDNTVVEVLGGENSEFDSLTVNPAFGTQTARFVANQLGVTSVNATGGAVLAQVRLMAVGTTGSSSPLTLVVITLKDNDGIAIPYTITPGATAAIGGLGDANSDGVVDVYDCVSIARFIAGIPVPGANEAAMNVDGEDGVDAFDCTYLARHIAGIAGHELGG